LADVFISYSREDQELIQSLAESLQAEGFSVWWDRNIGGGAEFARAIERELSAAKTVLVAWSTASIGSHWVRDEADYARGEDKLLPLSLDGVPPPLGLGQMLGARYVVEGSARKYIAKAKDPNLHLRPEKIVGMVRVHKDRDKGAREYAILEELWNAGSEPTTQS
jgi:hypothetical protein